jgi:hypothetical protein
MKLIPVPDGDSFLKISLECLPQENRSKHARIKPK